MMGTEPIESEMPIDASDFLNQTRVALNIYYNLQDNWDGMNGVYLGKSLQGIDTLFFIFGADNIPFQRYVLEVIRFVDNVAYKEIERNKKAKSRGRNG